MITRENIQAVIDQISIKDKKRIHNTSKEYIVLLLHVFNVGSITQVILTNDYNRYKNVSYNGNCILESSDPVFSSITGFTFQGRK